SLLGEAVQIMVVVLGQVGREVFRLARDAQQFVGEIPHVLSGDKRRKFDLVPSANTIPGGSFTTPFSTVPVTPILIYYLPTKPEASLCLTPRTFRHGGGRRRRARRGR